MLNVNMNTIKGRSEKFPTQYESVRTSVSVDVLEAGLVTAFLIIIFCGLVSSFRTKHTSFISISTRGTLSLLIGLFLMLANFGQDWESGEIITKTQYVAGSSQEINASIGVHVGLRSVNVTLKQIRRENSHIDLPKNEEIDYNERFSWTWDQGRFGFGPQAGRLQREFRESQHRGIPLPILWIVEYFVIDGEGFRFGRFYRTAGWYTHMLLWSAFSCWILANIFFENVIRYGAYFLGFTGTLQIIAIVIWNVVRNPVKLAIPFEDATLTLSYGTSYWITLINGFICLITSTLILVLERYFNELLCIFFGIDPLQSYDEVYLSAEELNKYTSKRDTKLAEEVPLTNVELRRRNETPEFRKTYIRRTVIGKQKLKVNARFDEENKLFEHI